MAVVMEPSEKVYDWALTSGDRRRDVYHEKIAKLTLTESRRITLSLENFAEHWESFDCWVQIGTNHYFPTDQHPVETQTVPAGTYDFYFDCTALFRRDINKSVSGEVLLRVLNGEAQVGAVRVKYKFIAGEKGLLDVHAYVE